VVLLFVVLALLHGLIYATLIPPWQSPDEHGHFEYAWLISQHGPMVGPESISPEFQQRVLESMYSFDYWRLAHQPMPQVLPAGFTDPNDRWLVNSRPQVGDERPAYYLLVGGLLYLTNSQNIVMGMYLGRIVSVLLYSATVGLAVLAARTLFPQSLYMQIVPPAFLLFLPMLGEMGAAVSSDSMGMLSSSLFLISLIPIIRDGLSWPRVCATTILLALTLLSKKTTLFLIPTAASVIPIHMWTRGRRFSPRARTWLVRAGAGLIITTIGLALIPGNDAVGWAELTKDCGATRTTTAALQGKAALRTGACTKAMVAQILPPEKVAPLAGQQIVLQGWIRSLQGQAVAQVSLRDGVEVSQTQVTTEENWRPFTLTHTVSTSARQIQVRLRWGGTGGPLLFDQLALSTNTGDNLLVNASAEKAESLLVDWLSNVAYRAGASRHLIQQILSPQTWSLAAGLYYVQALRFCFHSFWGLFGSQALPLSQPWYWTIELACIAALVGNLIMVTKSRRTWQKGFLLTLMSGLIFLALQTFLPLVVNRGTAWLPQGRYLFPGILALALVIPCGIRQLLPGKWARHMALITVCGLAGFDLACLISLIVPYFYTSS
jgi:hypothetical protein